MFPAQKFCYVLSLRSGCLVIAFYGLLCAGLNMDFLVSVLNHSKTVETNYVFIAEEIGALHFAAEFLLFMASLLLFISTMMKRSFLVLGYIMLAALHILYLIVFSVISCTMEVNIFTNFNTNACIAYWLWVALSCVFSPYFIFIALSYYQTKQTEDVVEQIL